MKFRGFRPISAWGCSTTILLAVMTVHGSAVLGGDESTDVAAGEGQRPALVLTEDTTLEPGQKYGAIVIQRSGIVVDGAGATLTGPVFQAGGIPRDYTGTGISAAGISGVTLRNLTVRGWEVGLRVSAGHGWLIENCDFSDNFSDPAFGWGENGRRGGIVLTDVHDSVLLRNRACRVWDACVLVDCDGNLLQDNVFSHCSNTCLKLWHSSRNRIRRNQLSYGIRKDPGEVHARDSTCVLIESGSNGNTLTGNDCTHGGDGIFVRVLNGWDSTGNLFERNDCSWANNNGVECWAAGNRFVGNRANHCSYGFWLGGSDRTELIDNEASFNGLPEGNHNSPHLPDSGHAGIVFMFGSSTHIVASGNRLEGNHGAGIALLGDVASQGKLWQAAHWILEKNSFVENRWGIFGQHVNWAVLTGNRYERNSLAEVHWQQDVDNIQRHDDVLPGDWTITDLRLSGPETVVHGQAARWDVNYTRSTASTKPNVQWQIDRGELHDGETIQVQGLKPGFHRLNVNVRENGQTRPLWKNIYVVCDVMEIGTEAGWSEWEIADYNERTLSPVQSSAGKFSADSEGGIVGLHSLHCRLDPYAGQRVVLIQDVSERVPDQRVEDLVVSFWLKTLNEDMTGWQGGPFLLLRGRDGTECWLEPSEGRDLMRQLQHPEERMGWRLLQLPLRGNDAWRQVGKLPQQLSAIGLGFDSWGAPPLEISVDGLAIE